MLGKKWVHQGGVLLPTLCSPSYELDRSSFKLFFANVLTVIMTIIIHLDKFCIISYITVVLKMWCDSFFLCIIRLVDHQDPFHRYCYKI